MKNLIFGTYIIGGKEMNITNIHKYSSNENICYHFTTATHYVAVVDEENTLDLGEALELIYSETHPDQDDFDCTTELSNGHKYTFQFTKKAEDLPDIDLEFKNIYDINFSLN
jgi:hypothetical protein